MKQKRLSKRARLGLAHLRFLAITSKPNPKPHDAHYVSVYPDGRKEKHMIGEYNK
jgi:hypothetical protein